MGTRDRSGRAYLEHFNLRTNLYFLGWSLGQLRGRRRDVEVWRVGRSS